MTEPQQFSEQEVEAIDFASMPLYALLGVDADKLSDDELNQLSQRVRELNDNNALTRALSEDLSSEKVGRKTKPKKSAMEKLADLGI